MSKQGKRKITVELPKQKDLSNRPSVFERLGIKKASSAKKTTEHCRQWAQHGSCAYGKSCKFASTHTLISPSKQRAAIKDSELKRSVKDDPKSRLHSSVVVRPGHSPDGEIDNWDQNDLDYADADALEKRRLQLQRELELQLKMDGKDMRKDKKKPVSSTSSSRSSSSSSVSSSSSDGSSSSSSSDRDTRRKIKKGKLKRNSSSSSEPDVPPKKKFNKGEIQKKDKILVKKNIPKKDDKTLKKIEATKKKTSSKSSIGKKSLSPAKKSGGTPPITSKTLSKNLAKHAKSPARRERNRSASPHSTRDRDKDRDRKEKERDKDRDKDREKTKPRSRSPKKARSRSPRPHKDSRRKESSERSRPVSPKKQLKKDSSSDRHRKRSASRDRDRGRDHKDRSLERRKDKNDDKDRHDRKDRGRDRKDKRDDKRRNRGSGREGLGRSSDKGLEKPNKPMERLLPRPEERLAALAAISNRAVETDKNSTTSKDRADTHSERGGRKMDRERDRSIKRDRLDSMDREPGDYEMDRPYETDRVDHYDRGDDRYEAGARDGDRSPSYMQGRERHYDPGYDMAGPPRGYAEDDDRMYDRVGDRRDIGYDDRRPHRDRSWDGRSSIDRERGYMHPHKEWDNEDYRAAGDWGRDRRWPMHESQMNEWGDKDPEMEGWHHRGHPGHRGRMHENYGRGMRMDHKRRGPPRNDPPPAEKQPSPAQPVAVAAPARTDTGTTAADPDDKTIPDDLSEISDDADDILNREDMVDQNMDDDSETGPLEDNIKLEPAERESTQDTSGAAEERDSKDINDDEDTNLDFEEISDGELEEERTRAGLGDALGVDWASLVADVHRREQITPSGGARDRWKPEKVLTRVGLSIQMAGKEIVQEILNKNAQTDKEESGQSQSTQKCGTDQNGTHEGEEDQQPSAPDVNSLHPVAAIQVAIEKRKRQRAILFGSGCEITRGLSARRDLALRRFLCHLPATERTGQSRLTPQPSLFQAAKALLVQAKSG